jgi:uncharacterized protein with HEPN domain
MKSDKKLLNDMLQAIVDIDSYHLTTFADFNNDKKTQDAVMFNLIILGEAANRISKEYQESHPEIPWSSFIGSNEVIVHGYGQVKLLIVWEIIQKHLPILKPILKLLV